MLASFDLKPARVGGSGLTHARVTPSVPATTSTTTKTRHSAQLVALWAPRHDEDSIAAESSHVVRCFVRRVQLAVDQVCKPALDDLQLLLRDDASNEPHGREALGDGPQNASSPAFGLPASVWFALRRDGLVLPSHAAHAPAAASDAGDVLPTTTSSRLPSHASFGGPWADLWSEPLAASSLHRTLSSAFFPPVPGSVHLPDVQQGLLPAELPPNPQPLSHW